jgi:hypothetical protein
VKNGWKMRFGAVALSLVAIFSLHQAAGAQVMGPGRPNASLTDQSTSIQSVPSTLTVREIDDPHSGARWLLMRDQGHPGGPGHLVLASGLQNGARADRQRLSTLRTEPIPLLPVIRVGDKVIVEESSPVIEARLEAVALGPAAVGSALEVRLRIGGKVVRAVALAPGRATLQPEIEVRP